MNEEKPANRVAYAFGRWVLGPLLALAALVAVLVVLGFVISAAVVLVNVWTR